MGLVMRRQTQEFSLRWKQVVYLRQHELHQEQGVRYSCSLVFQELDLLLLLQSQTPFPVTKIRGLSSLGLQRSMHWR